MEVEKSIRWRRKRRVNKECGNERMHLEVGQSGWSVGKSGKEKVGKGKQMEKGIDKKSILTTVVLEID